MQDASAIVGIDTEHDRDESMAVDMLKELVKTYPGHSWFVVIRGGVVHVKDMDISHHWGMCLHYSDIKDDAKERTKSLLRSAGEFLERANLKRGAKTDRAMHVEGIADKYLVRR